MVNQLKYDFCQGIYRKLWLFLPVVIMVIISCIYLDKEIMLCNMELVNPERATFADYLVKIFKGSEVVVKTSSDADIKIAPEFVFIYTYYVIIISSFIFKDFYGNGFQYIIRLRKKCFWWISKICWLLSFTVMYFAIILVALFGYNIIAGDGKLISDSSYIINNILHMSLERINIDTTSWLVQGMLEILIFIILMGLLVNVIAIFINPIGGIIFGMAEVVLALFFKSDFIIGNHLMLLRKCEGDSFNNFAYQVAIVVALIAIFAVVGYYIFSKKEILGRKVA